jgi:DNA-binding response OmpR family regulator
MEATRTIRLLHVEDDESQRHLLAHHLKKVPDCTFAITVAESEARALAAFDAHQTDFVILDYQLEAGDGLSCLQSIRRRDATVPIIAVSGTASPEAAADLLHNGADDFLRKQEMTSDILARSIQTALARADAWRQRSQSSPGLVHARSIVQLIHQSLLSKSEHWLLQHFETLEQLVHRTGLSHREWSDLLMTPLAVESENRLSSIAALLLRALLVGLREQIEETN